MTQVIEAVLLKQQILTDKRHLRLIDRAQMPRPAALCDASEQNGKLW